MTPEQKQAEADRITMECVRAAMDGQRVPLIGVIACAMAVPVLVGCFWLLIFGGV